MNSVIAFARQPNGIQQRTGRKLPVLFALIISMVLGPIPALAQQQNLVVRPMKVEADVPPNRTARVIVNVRNQHPTRTEPVNLEVVHITQSRDGSLRIVTDEMLAEEMSEEEAERLLKISSKEWIGLPAGRIEIAPETTEEIPVLIRVPPRMRGTYISGVMIQTDEPEMPAGTGAEREAIFAIRFGFLVPFINGIRGAAVRQNVSISDVVMEFDDGTDGQGNQFSDPTTRVFMEIVNEGLTYSDLRGEVRVERLIGDQWRLVTIAEMPRQKILPGITLELAADLERRLPSGEYRLVGNLSVDGRRSPRFEKVIDFEGDPEIDRIAFDTNLLLDPLQISVVAVPGSTRASAVTITNPGDQPLTVEIAALTPDVFVGKAMGNMMGEELSAADWTDIRPNEFLIRPGQRRNVRVMSHLPREGVAHANYYADIVLSGRYEDGQSAGDTRSLLHVRQEAIENRPVAMIERISLSEGDVPGLFYAQLRFLNIGNVHLEPTGMMQLISEEGALLSTRRLAGEQSALLPLDSRDLAAEFDLSDLDAGNYVLRATAESGADLRIVQEYLLSLSSEEEQDDRGRPTKRLHVDLQERPAEVAPASTSDADQMNGGDEDEEGDADDEN